MSKFSRSCRSAARCLAAAAAASLVAFPILSAHGQVIGINAAVRNSVQLRGAGTQQLRPAVLRQRVGLNDEVRTGSQSQLQILLLDRSVFTVGSNARLTVDRFVYDPRRSIRSVGATVTRGAFRFMSGRSLGPSSNDRSIRTPVATIGIRGTIVDGVVGRDAIDIAAAESAVGPDVGSDDGTASLIILRGPGPQAQGDSPRGVVDIDTETRDLVLDRPSLAVYIPRRGAAPIGPFLISRAGLIRVQQLLSPPLSIVPMIAGEVGPAGPGQDPQGPAGGSGPVDRPGRDHGPLLLAGGAVLIVALIVLLADGGNGADGGNPRPNSP